MGGTGEVVTYAELDAAANRLSPAAPRRRPAAGRPRRLLHGEPPALPRGRAGAATTPGSIYTACSSRLTHARARVHRQRLRRAGVHHLARTRPTRRPRSLAETPGVELRLMLDGAIDGYESYEDGRRRAARRAAARADRAAPTCSTRRARPAGRRASRPRVPDEPLGERRPTSVAGARRCCSASRRTTVYLSPGAALPRRAAALLHGRRSALGGTVVVMEHFDPEQYLALDRALPGDPQPGRADDVRPHAEAARRGARPLRPVVAAGARSTPRRRARSRSRRR